MCRFVSKAQCFLTRSETTPPTWDKFLFMWMSVFFTVVKYQFMKVYSCHLFTGRKFCWCAKVSSFVSSPPQWSHKLQDILACFVQWMKLTINLFGSTTCCHFVFFAFIFHNVMRLHYESGWSAMHGRKGAVWYSWSLKDSQAFCNGFCCEHITLSSLLLNLSVCAWFIVAWAILCRQGFPLKFPLSVACRF